MTYYVFGGTLTFLSPTQIRAVLFDTVQPLVIGSISCSISVALSIQKDVRISFLILAAQMTSTVLLKY